MRRLAPAGAAVALLLCGITACSLPKDKEPQRFPMPAAAEQALKQVSSTTTIPTTTKDEALYYLTSSDDEREEGLVRVDARIKETRSRSEEALAVLDALKVVPIDRAQDLRSNLNQNTKINRVDIHENVAEVDLALPLTGAAQRLAIAQIVFSLTDLDGIDSVKFFVNGEATNPLGGTTDSPDKSISRDDFPRLKEALEAAASTTVPPAPGG